MLGGEQIDLGQAAVAAEHIGKALVAREHGGGVAEIAQAFDARERRAFRRVDDQDRPGRTLDDNAEIARSAQFGSSERRIQGDEQESDQKRKDADRLHASPRSRGEVGFRAVSAESG